MKMELHPLLCRGILPLGLLPLHNGVGLQYHIVGIALDSQPALNDQMLTLLDPVNERLPLILQEKLIDPNGAGIIGDIEAHHPGVGLF